MSRPDERQLASMIAEARELLDTIETGHTNDPRVVVPTAVSIIGWARVRSRDGFPTSSMGGDGSGPHWKVTDESGREERIPVTSVEASVELDHVVADPVRRAALDLVRMLGGALGDLRVAVGAQHAAARAHGVSSAERALADEMWCVVHLRHRMFEPRDSRRPNTERCRWCYDFALSNGVDPPRELLDARARGRSVSASMVDRALGRKRRAS